MDCVVPRGGGASGETMNLRRLLLGLLLAIGFASAYALACGPFLVDYPSVTAIHPAHPDSYREGRVGVVRPRFARRYLVQAYRRFTGQPAIPDLVPRPSLQVDPPPETALEQWLAFRRALVTDAQRDRRVNRDRRV